MSRAASASHQVRHWTGTVYGLTHGRWGFLPLTALGQALIVNGMLSELASIYYSTASTIFVGIMTCSRADPAQLAFHRNAAGWFIVVAAVAPFFGYPTHYLVFALPPAESSSRRPRRVAVAAGKSSAADETEDVDE